MDDQITNLPEVTPSNSSSKAKTAWLINSIKSLLLIILSFPIFMIIVSLVFLGRFLVDLQGMVLPSFFYDVIAVLVTTLIIYALAKLLRLGKAKVFALVIFIVYIILLDFVNFFYRPSSHSQPMSIPTITPTHTLPTITPTHTYEESESTPIPPPYYIKLLENTFTQGKAAEPSKKAPLDCQPELFDPQTAKFTKGKEEGPFSEYYVTEPGGEHFMIDGWRKEGESKINLPDPYKVTMYEFGCASTFSFVLDITKNKERLFLFTHIDSFSFSTDKKKLFLINRVKTNNGWISKRRFIDLETKKEINLPSFDCPGTGFWENNYFLSYEYPEDGKYQEPIKVCVWDKSGKISQQFSLVLDWTVGAGYYLNSQFGFLPNEKNVFYSTTIFYGKCLLALQDINDQKKNKSFDLVDDETPIHCPEEMEIDLKNLRLSSEKVKFRYLEYSEDLHKEIWSPWKEATAQ